MVIYYILFFLVYILSNATNKAAKKQIFLIVFSLLTIIGVIRDVSVGNDLHGSYLANWNAATLDPNTWGVASEMEVGFMCFMAYFKNIIDDYYVFYGVVFILTMIGYAKIFKEYSINPTLSFSFLILFLFYTTPFNAMRQSLALALTYPVIKLLLRDSKKDLFFFVIYVLFVALLFHRTIIIFLILPVVLRIKWINNLLYGKKVIIVLLVSYTLVFASKMLLAYAPEISLVLSILGARYSEYLTVYLDIESETISYYTALLHTLVAIYITIIYKKNKSTDIFYICLICGVIFQNTFGAFSALFMRVGHNLRFFEVILFANMWVLLPYKKNILFKFVILIYGLIFFTNSLIKNFGEVVPYSSYLF